MAVAGGEPIQKVFTVTVESSAAPVLESATITFDSTDKRTTYSTSQQLWTENNITVTNDKASSTSNVGNYSNPARFYKSSSLTVAFTQNVTKIVFECNSTSYAEALVESIGTQAGVTVTVDGKNVTIEFDAPTNSFTIAAMSAQVRVNGLTVYYVPEA